ncbi:MAG: hypothetical protein KF762_06275 [Acidobacteria bacterium]|nr:hypothetical protein [Acidobacteriota bacterium]
MAEEYSDRFQGEVMRILGTLVEKVSEHGNKLDSISHQLELQQEELRIIDGRVLDIASKVLEIDKRCTVIEAKIGLVEHKLSGLESEVRQVRMELDDLNERFEKGSEVKSEIDQLSIRVFQLEEKLAA